MLNVENMYRHITLNILIHWNSVPYENMCSFKVQLNPGYLFITFIQTYLSKSPHQTLKLNLADIIRDLLEVQIKLKASRSVPNDPLHSQLTL